MDIDLRANETLLEQAKGDYWTNGLFGFLGATQERGEYAFTNQRIIFNPATLFKGTEDRIEIDYNQIHAVKKCFVALYIPTGIHITTIDGKKYRFSLLKRNKWIELINQHKIM